MYFTRGNSQPLPVLLDLFSRNSFLFGEGIFGRDELNILDRGQVVCVGPPACLPATTEDFE